MDTALHTTLRQIAREVSGFSNPPHKVAARKAIRSIDQILYALSHELHNMGADDVSIELGKVIDVCNKTKNEIKGTWARTGKARPRRHTYIRSGPGDIMIGYYPSREV